MSKIKEPLHYLLTLVADDRELQKKGQAAPYSHENLSWLLGELGKDVPGIPPIALYFISEALTYNPSHLDQDPLPHQLDSLLERLRLNCGLNKLRTSPRLDNHTEEWTAVLSAALGCYQYTAPRSPLYGNNERFAAMLEQFNKTEIYFRECGITLMRAIDKHLGTASIQPVRP